MERLLTGGNYYYPPIEGNEWETALPADLGWDSTALEQTVSYVRDHNSTAFLILQRGKMVVEEYWQGWGIGTAMPIFSAAKSVTSVLIGIFFFLPMAQIVRKPHIPKAKKPNMAFLQKGQKTTM